MRLSELIFGIVAFAAAIPGAAAQQPELPEMEIYLAPLSGSPDNIRVGVPANITNHPGYDNQPFFLPDGKSLFYVSAGENRKTDIWQYDLAAGTRTQLTDTPRESEYSPKLAPDGNGLSVIHEPESGVGQQVWRYDLDDPKSGRPVLAFRSTGYHAWGQGERYLAVFALGEPPTLRLADMWTGSISVMFENIGRALYALPDGSGYTFTQQLEGARFGVRRLELSTMSVSELFDLPGTSQDYALLPDAENPSRPDFLSADGAQLYFRDGAGAGEWRAVADFSSHGIKKVTRLAVSSDLKSLAFVVVQ